MEVARFEPETSELASEWVYVSRFRSKYSAEWDKLAQNPFLAFYQRWPWLCPTYSAIQSLETHIDNSRSIDLLILCSAHMVSGDFFWPGVYARLTRFSFHSIFWFSSFLCRDFGVAFDWVLVVAVEARPCAHSGAVPLMAANPHGPRMSHVPRNVPAPSPHRTNLRASPPFGISSRCRQTMALLTCCSLFI